MGEVERGGERNVGSGGGGKRKMGEVERGGERRGEECRERMGR